MTKVRPKPVSPIVITGARGYIGAALVGRLAAEGHELRLVSRSSDAWQIDRSNVSHMVADLRDEATWAACLADAEALVHLSARTNLRAAEVDPSGDEAINVEPVRALIRAATRRGGRPLPVVFASTVTIVGDRHTNPVDEQTPDRPCSVYDRNKLACERLLAEATRCGTVQACSLRLSNVYGFGRASTNADRGMLNVMLKRAGHGEPLTVFGEGRYIRDFVHLDDVVAAICAALGSDQARDGRHYVIASGRGISLADAIGLVASTAFRHTGQAVEVRHVPEPDDLHPIERRSFVGNSALFASTTGWQPRIGLEDGIEDYFVGTARRSERAREFS